MKILRLELFGFKSFKDKTVITFDQPITGIIGSNGCGKSNVVDALYWVMGDMSPKHLRGATMIDVIFSGSKDTAALDLAEVTLVMERNPETDAPLPPQYSNSTEIQITRRYYRSGEGEYLINKVPCRLRDIQEFFMDTGMGAKAYSIIEQGAISRMVSLKPEDRRVVIEEVAGIMKFKARKAETLRKIENSKVNLQRVDDILGDLQKQLQSLKRQADKAEKFRDLSEKLKSLEIRLGTREWMDRNDAKAKVEALAQELAAALAKLEIDGNDLRKTTAELESEVARLETEVDLARTSLREEELKHKESEGLKQTLVAREKQILDRSVTLQNEVQRTQTRDSELAQQLDELHAQSMQLSESVDVLRTNVKELEHNQTEVQQKAEAARGDLSQSQKALHEVELAHTRGTQELQSLQRQSQNTARKIQELTDTARLVSEQLVTKSTERTAALEDLEKSFATRSELEAKKLDLDAQLAKLEEDRGQLTADRDEAKAKASGLRERRTQLQALEDEMDGLEASTKVILSKLRENNTQPQVLADLVKVPHLLEKSVEALLGRHLQRIVGSELTSVTEATDVLRACNDAEARKGRAPLWVSGLKDRNPQLSIDEIFVGARNEEIPGPDGMMTTRSTAVSLREHLSAHPDVIGALDAAVALELDGAQPAWLELLRGTWVVRNRESMIELRQAIPDLPLTLVSLDGDVLYPNGFLDVAPLDPAARESSGLIGRKRIIEELKFDEAKTDAVLNEAQSQLDQVLSQIANQKDAFRVLTRSLAELNPDVERQSSLLRNVESQIARMSEKESLLKEQIHNAGQELAKLSQDVEILGERLLVLEQEKTSASSKMTEHQDLLAQALAFQNSLLEKLNTARQNLRQEERNLESVERSIGSAKQERELLAKRRDDMDQELSGLDGQIQQVKAELEEVTMRLGVLGTHVKQSSEALQEVQESYQKVRDSLRSSQSKLEEVLSLASRSQGELKDLQSRSAIEDVELRNLHERIQASHQVQLSGLSQEELTALATADDIEELADPSTAKEHALQLRRRIENLGRINMVAVDEFEDVKRRYEYLFIQRQDLSDALSQLKSAIEKIDSESKTRFEEAFYAVNGAFQTTFPILFGGGQAELRLTDPSNMLETGVEIVAQPPGKKLQSVTLLSGGEKALTAVSLIFGIFSIKPSPFCVLDEVDAPLDDANVGRFNNLLRTITDRSQIIMITHHKKTMESADALFGVTMEQPGISKLASVRIAEL